MTDRRSKSYWRRTLGLAVCYVLALQAFLAAYGTTLAVVQAHAETGFAICHGAGGSEPATDASGAISRIEQLNALPGATFVPKPYDPEMLCTLLGSVAARH